MSMVLFTCKDGFFNKAAVFYTLSISFLIVAGQVWPESLLPLSNAQASVAGQEWKYDPNPREVPVYIHYPGGSLDQVNARTGLMLSLHNWGGTHHIGTADPDVLADRYNVIVICVDYLQSGKWNSENGPPYDYGYLQAIDALRALGLVFNALNTLGIEFDSRRIYACGGSGGGNVTLMANKFAPRTFACVIDMSGMAKLSDDIAFNLEGGSRLWAGYVRDESSPNFLSPDAQEIRFIGHPGHLKQMKALGTECKIIISHGAADDVCTIADVREMAANMENAGLDVEAHFIAESDLDGTVFKNTGHSVGDRTLIVQHFADRYLLPDSPELRIREGKNDFERADDKVQYATANGTYIVSYKNGLPAVEFVKK